MSNYTKTTNFATKDSLPSGDPNKIVKGAEINTEFDNIATAVSTKANSASPTFTGTVTIPTADINGGAIDGTVIGGTTAASVTGTTLTANTSLNIAGDGATVTGIKDEDDMVSNSATKLATQQSIKAYVDSQVTAQDLDVTTDLGTISIDLDSETLTVAGGTGLDSSAIGNTVTLGIDSTVATLTGTQTLTNKTLTAPVISGNLTTDGTVDGRDIATDGTKLDGIEAGATADQTAAEIKTAYESNLDTNAFTDADHSKLDNIEANATADQTAAEIRTLVDSATDSNVFTDADHSKLDGIEASADVTDTANVTAAGALMDSELTNEAAVKALNQGVATTDSPTFAGLTTTADVSFGDNDKAIFGAGNDLQIYHDGFNSYIRDAGTGDLNLRGDGYVRVQSQTSGTSLAHFRADAEVALYYNNSNKLITTPTGVDVTGTVTADGITNAGDITLGAGDKLQYNSDRYFTPENNVDGAEISANGVFRVKTGTTPAARLLVGGNGDISFYDDTGTTPKFFWDASAERLGIGTSSPDQALTVSGNIQIQDNDGYLQFKDTNGGTNNKFRRIYNSAQTLYISRRNDDESLQANDVTIDSSGRVGIGTSSPDTLLNLAGDETAVIRLENTNGSASDGDVVGALQFYKADGSGAGAGVVGQIKMLTQGIGSGGHLTLSTGDANGNDVERLRVSSNGNVGIGTSSPQSDGNTTNLEVSSAFGARVLIANTDTNGRKYGFYSSNSGIFGLADYTASGTPTRMAIDSSGRVGIGTTSPSKTLTVAGTGLRVQSTASADFYSTAQDALIVNNGTDNLRFWNNGSERMRIDSSGNLLVGTTDQYALNGGFTVQTGAVDYISIGHTSSVSHGNYYAAFRHGTNTIGTISQNGTTGVLYNTSSDERLKENIADSADAGSKIDAIQIRQFDWKSDGSHQDYGVIAQELVEVAPEAVHQPVDSEDMMGVDYSKLVPMLIKEIQTLRNRVAQLETN